MDKGLYRSKRQRQELTRTELIRVRSFIESDWRDVGDYISPHRLRLELSDSNKVMRRNQNIIDGSATDASSILAAGMTSAICSPNRPWFRLTPPDKEMAEWGPVKDWLFHVQTVMLNTFSRSNYYIKAPTVFGDIGDYATAAMGIVEDFEDVINCSTFPIGSYYIAANHKGKVNTFGRDFIFTVRQLIEMFGEVDKNSGKPKWEKFSRAVKNMWDKGNYDAEVEVRHFIEPNLQYDRRNKTSKRFNECYYEAGCDEDKYLEESGYDYFPILVPRWAVTGYDAWGSDCPGFRSLGDVKQLQFGEEIGLQGLELNVRPPMVAHTSLIGKASSQIPGSRTYLDDVTQFKKLFDVDIRLDQLEMKQESVRRRIDERYYKPIFLRILSDERNQRATAQEIVEGKEEKFMVLGPTLSQVDRDFNDPSIDINFAMNLRQRRFRKPPPELAGQPLQIEYLNLMTQAQKMVGFATNERFLGYAERVFAINPEAMDKIDFDQKLDEAGDTLGVNPRVIRTDERVEEIRAGRQQAAQSQATMDAINQGSQAAKNLSQTDLEGDNALSALLNSQGGQ